MFHQINNNTATRTANQHLPRTTDIPHPKARVAKLGEGHERCLAIHVAESASGLGPDLRPCTGSRQCWGDLRAFFQIAVLGCGVTTGLSRCRDVFRFALKTPLCQYVLYRISAAPPCCPPVSTYRAVIPRPFLPSGGGRTKPCLIVDAGAGIMDNRPVILFDPPNTPTGHSFRSRRQQSTDMGPSSPQRRPKPGRERSYLGFEPFCRRSTDLKTILQPHAI